MLAVLNNMSTVAKSINHKYHLGYLEFISIEHHNYAFLNSKCTMIRAIYGAILMYVLLLGVTATTMQC